MPLPMLAEIFGVQMLMMTSVNQSFAVHAGPQIAGNLANLMGDMTT